MPSTRCTSTPNICVHQTIKIWIPKLLSTKHFPNQSGHCVYTHISLEVEYANWEYIRATNLQDLMQTTQRPKEQTGYVYISLICTHSTLNQGKKNDFEKNTTTQLLVLGRSREHAEYSRHLCLLHLKPYTTHQCSRVTLKASRSTHLCDYNIITECFCWAYLWLAYWTTQLHANSPIEWEECKITNEVITVKEHI